MALCSRIADQYNGNLEDTASVPSASGICYVSTGRLVPGRLSVAPAVRHVHLWGGTGSRRPVAAIGMQPSPVVRLPHCHPSRSQTVGVASPPAFRPIVSARPVVPPVSRQTTQSWRKNRRRNGPSLRCGRRQSSRRRSAWTLFRANDPKSLRLFRRRWPRRSILRSARCGFSVTAVSCRCSKGGNNRPFPALLCSSHSQC